MSETPMPSFTPSPAATAEPSLPLSFIDSSTGAVRVDALLRAYRALEAELADLKARVGSLPASAEAYDLSCDHGLFQPDPDINARLHGAGYSTEQAQLLYDLAAERMIPMIRAIAEEYQARREMERLVSQFGGEERWREVARQLKSWGARNLPAPALEGLATTFDGVMALYRMMTNPEPGTLRGSVSPLAAGETDLHALMRDPKYWRDRDPATVLRVTDGFRRLYPGT